MHSTSPAIVHHQRIVRVFPGKRIAEHRAHPRPQLIPGIIRPAGEGAQKHRRSLKARARRKPGLKRPQLRIQPHCAADFVSMALQADAGAAAELNACIPSRMRLSGRENKIDGNDLACFSLDRMCIGR